MKKGLLIIVACSIVSLLNAQIDEAAVQKEIDEQVWRPFIESWSNFDAEAFNNLHTDDMIRASASGLRTGSEYKLRNTERFAQNKAEGRTRSIEFWFEHRKTNANISYEVGYYKIIIKIPGQDEGTYYARFHVVLKKITGQWKVVQDWDTNNINGNEVTAADYAKKRGEIIK